MKRLATGMDNYLAKSFRQEDREEKIRYWLTYVDSATTGGKVALGNDRVEKLQTDRTTRLA
ncbi:MAG: hypothetical protein ACE5EH_05000 [Gammaproteobacteria bacterium]